MPMRSCLICLFINLFVCLCGYAQAPNRADSLRPILLLNKWLNDSSPLPGTGRPFMLPSSALKERAFFCRKEKELEQWSRLPLRLRLGNLQYTDMMENKMRNVTVQTLQP